jgi:hypothetical protein
MAWEDIKFNIREKKTKWYYELIDVFVVRILPFYLGFYFRHTSSLWYLIIFLILFFIEVRFPSRMSEKNDK